MELKPLSQDLSIFSKLNLERQPVGVKFLYNKPEGITQLDKELALCEMFKEAQNRDTPFYITKQNENCTGKLALGWMDMPSWAASGQIGEKFQIFQAPRANQRLYQYFHEFKPGIVNYLVFSRLEELSYEPDLLILTAKPSQAEIVLRAMTYSTGELWQPKATPVLGCSWLYVYPYETGNVNYVMTGMHFGMKAREVFPEGLVIISIPYNWIPVITQNLKEMNWVLPAYSLGREAWMKVEEETLEQLKNTNPDN
jgi:uncharacterized protein (DUF169 family)